MSALVTDWDLHGDAPPPADPFCLARAWLPPDDHPDRPWVTLATIGEDGCPNARTVLLSAFDESGFVFHTASTSQKVAELAALPQASMALLWPCGTRQLVVRGGVVPDADHQSVAAWSRRTDYLKHLAWTNTDEFAGLRLSERRRLWAVSATGCRTRQPAPSWVGFRLQPREMTFWAAAPDTASRRVQYVRSDDGWNWRHRAG